MKYIVDLHTHTIASDHAYSTIVECAHSAKENGVVMFATTDHGPAVSDGPHPWHFNNLKVVPRFCEGVAVLRGIEANFLQDGTIDAKHVHVQNLDIVLAGFHPNLQPTTKEEHTKIATTAIKSGMMDIMSHPGVAAFDMDYEELLVCARDNNVAIEINSSSDVNTRYHSFDNCVKIAKLAKKIGTKISLGTDAHICYYIGNFEQSIKVLKEADIKDSQIINESPLKVLDFLESRGHKPIVEMREFFLKA